MKRFVAVGLFVVLLGGALPSFAATFVVHGIDGRDLGLDQSLPVDVKVGDACALTNLQFREIEGPIDLAPGKYHVEVRLSDGSCSGALAVTSEIDIAIAENASVVAHLTEQGTPTLTKFVNDVRAAEHGNARVTVRHSAAAPPVRVLLYRRYRATAYWGLQNPRQRQAEVRHGDYHAAIYRSDAGFRSDLIAGPLPLSLDADVAYFVYALGSLKNDSFDLLIQTIALGSGE